MLDARVVLWWGALNGAVDSWDEAEPPYGLLPRQAKLSIAVGTIPPQLGLCSSMQPHARICGFSQVLNLSSRGI